MPREPTSQLVIWAKTRPILLPIWTKFVKVYVDFFGLPVAFSFQVVNVVVNKCPGGLANIRSVYMQPVGGSPSLPIYIYSGQCSSFFIMYFSYQVNFEDHCFVFYSLGIYCSPLFFFSEGTSEVKPERPQKRRRAIEQVSDECSTLPDGLKLAVRKNGKVRVISEDSNVAVHYPTVHDEWEERDGLKPTIDPAKLKRKHAIKKKRLQKRVSHKKIKSGEKVTVRPESLLKAE
ncbi:hypothetical protein Y032_0340g2987 [Ancylostoma ceylanicum]|uniref:Uncharacterized protein n=1 Tax=Ancylostoma ceylanicum TaxID=53326 RepID=A0A016RXU3_9BILA|nr:hypothetical protein Y032_0340g2987 [Ancylostoma ceylanicum]